MNIPVVFQDDCLLVINKPSGIVVNRSESTKGQTLQDWIENTYKTNFNLYSVDQNSGTDDFKDRSGVVHRLDKDTSGLLIIALNYVSFTNLQRQFYDRIVEKKYLTLVHGKMQSVMGTIKAPVGRLPWDRQKFGVISSGREAETSFKAMSYYSNNNAVFSLLDITPHTGRTHQIRIHLKYYGYPVVSDRLYCGRVRYKDDLKFCSRLFLHAYYLKFRHPAKNSWIELRTDLPEELKNVLDSINKVDLY
ncbi:RluA family pseudouridine synthase [Candidatus Gottesmanbacteria bacterium CG11_big_fil_rev_8_21_14_0_20_37_11]|uniref:Pseudouridine synthase n=3 Tax=Candidatus Gottesmaniibacteriota TaxID=1752720 RepID=A0A2M7RP78_9BACT|nr:MAG: hypothetical protein AUJ73_05115 [Candidatus Gottesmanbacteria bacterium CG1_02_37_22]PIP33253.1 MAG: RluA family pseudouridine synthase [Candidatus Gottesmanbacteria bacterium CG23_combo_of_CG06-09_8_20_14_all_37_19]PIR08111.1 MAG: RluA family pseudouridine synthase [Candidatus Gottesmanbacteria bacterium CG11_big_fil_rev_8_21_14_0_20_37_11]PIZ02137.1 MAG: RluA family pseudouridine synthase [Candidatus Gottesmanbacteria bacterium CG_4_10_14_0_8_um_filter_37_24]